MGVLPGRCGADGNRRPRVLAAAPHGQDRLLDRDAVHLARPDERRVERVRWARIAVAALGGWPQPESGASTRMSQPPTQPPGAAHWTRRDRSGSCGRTQWRMRTPRQDVALGSTPANGAAARPLRTALRFTLRSSPEANAHTLTGLPSRTLAVRRAGVPGFGIPSLPCPGAADILYANANQSYLYRQSPSISGSRAGCSGPG